MLKYVFKVNDKQTVRCHTKIAGLFLIRFKQILPNDGWGIDDKHENIEVPLVRGFHALVKWWLKKQTTWNNSSVDISINLQ